MFCFLLSCLSFFFVEYLCLLLSFCFIPWLIFPTYRVLLKIIITNVGFFSSFSHSALKKLIRNFFLPYFHKKIKSAVVACLLVSSSTYKLPFFFIPASVSRFGRGDATEESTGTRSIFEKLLETDPDQPSFEEFLTKAVIFGAIMLYFWLCDYQHVW